MKIGKRSSYKKVRARPKTFVDLFAGCGGLSLGLMHSGWQGLLAVEKDASAFKSLKLNLINASNGVEYNWPNWFPKAPCRISAINGKYRKNFARLRGEVNLIAGGPPCQGFSFAGKRTGKDPRNELFKHHLEVVDIIKPELVLMENVQGIETAFGVGKKPRKKQRGRPKKSYASRIREKFEEHGYEVQPHVLKAVDFGVPQFRPRYFTLGIRKDLLLGIDEPDLQEVLAKMRNDFLKQRGLPIKRPVNVADAISDLTTDGKQLVECLDEESPPGFKEIVYKGPKTLYQKLMRTGMDGRAPNSLRLVNHRPETIQRFQEILRTCRKGVQLSEEDRARLSIRKSAIVPLAPDQPSHTLTTLPDDLLHYAEPRIHTVREHARLQSFPDWFEFRGNYTTGGDRRARECPRYTQVGNAVPPLLAEAIGEALLAILDGLQASRSLGPHGRGARRVRSVRRRRS